MIALDTNVLLRFLVADDAAQNRRAAEFIETVLENKGTLYISDIVLVETVWVLELGHE